MGTKLSALSAYASTLASTDLVEMVDVSDTTHGAGGTSKKMTIANFIANSPNGGLAEKGAANSFTQAQTITAAAAGDVALVVSTAASPTASAVRFLYNGTTQVSFMRNGIRAEVVYGAAFDNGANEGNYIFLDRNSNASTPAAGFVKFVTRTAAVRSIWVDASGDLRINTANPTNANDAAGTVVGTQTSMAAAKLLEPADGDARESLGHVMQAAREGLRAWRYKGGGYNNERFPVGLVTDLAPRYGMDRGKDAPAGRSLNIPVAIGDLFRAVAYLAEQIGVEVEHG